MAAAECAKAVLFLGESNGFWIQTGAIILSAIAGVWVIRSNGFSSRRRATIDHIIHQKTDEKLILDTRTVFDLHRKNVKFSEYSDKKDSAERKAILSVLNNHEFIALAIRRGAFEEKIYKELQFTNFKKVHTACVGFVAEIRKSENNQKIFQEFDWLIDKWDSCPLKKIKDQKAWCNPMRFFE